MIFICRAIGEDGAKKQYQDELIDCFKVDGFQGIFFFECSIFWNADVDPGFDFLILKHDQQYIGIIIFFVKIFLVYVDKFAYQHEVLYFGATNQYGYYVSI